MSDARFDVIVVRCSAEGCDYEYGDDLDAAWEAHAELGSCPGCNRDDFPEVVRVNRLDELIDAAREVEETAAMIAERQPALIPRLDAALAAPRALVSSLLEAVR